MAKVLRRFARSDRRIQPIQTIRDTGPDVGQTAARASQQIGKAIRAAAEIGLRRDAAAIAAGVSSACAVAPLGGPVGPVVALRAGAAPRRWP